MQLFEQLLDLSLFESLLTFDEKTFDFNEKQHLVKAFKLITSHSHQLNVF